ncbi:hypothetical protein SLEP1_g49824 [Rubroshorea leprosula]|uniref:Uncharacterized protein n=1 Tax=Rubroshorea leprosula TaxID=152421 RepID=A0AAV5M0I2_9ROSI|nr:hypothetical protein SLEP1_g49824 [Rubroshorea leprosula]
MLSYTIIDSFSGLILSRNSLSGNLPVQGFTKLKILDLSSNLFRGTIPSSIGALHSLRALFLSSNWFNGSLPNLGFTRLEILDLSGNQFSGAIPPSIEALHSLKALFLSDNQLNGSLPNLGFTRLEILYLSSNQFSGAIPLSIVTLHSLKALSLSSNQFNDSLPNPGLCGLKRLQELDLSQNSFEGTLPPCLNNLTSLKLLDISNNFFSKNLSSDLIQSLPLSLEFIDLRHNNFQGLFSFNYIRNYSKLEVFMLTGYKDRLQVDAQCPNWINMLFQCKELILSDLSMTSIPKFLFYQQKLRAIDLSHNKLKEEFPVWLLQNNSNLKFMNLMNNSFVGQLYLPSHEIRNMVCMDLSNNHFTGKLPKDFGDKLLGLQYLNLCQNQFVGALPSSLGNMRDLVTLNLAFNFFSGEVPTELLMGCSKLEDLRLSYNRLKGQFFSSKFNLTSLRHLELNDNGFAGSLLNVKLETLTMLDVSNNYFRGPIPTWVNQVSFLISLRNNSFEGQFPCQQSMSNWLHFLDFSHNFLSGHLPSCIDFTNINEVHLEGNKFTGLLQNFLPNSSCGLSVLNLRDNNLSGFIPDLSGTFLNLKILLLGKNHLKGLIPETLCLLENISIMDLSSNSFSGTIPFCFQNLTFGVRENYGDTLIQDKWLFGNMFTDENHIYGDFIKKNLDLPMYIEVVALNEIYLVDKNRGTSYKGSILNFMSALDMSCNDLTGEIPQELGKLTQIRALNLSHNQLSGPIPITLSKLSNIESLDLSYNNLSGNIPLELTNLNFLEVFNVSYNNLSGEIPMKGQFSTFEESSYAGNQFLSRLPLEKCCIINTETPHLELLPSDATKGKWYEVDLLAFYACFSPAYAMFFLLIVSLLYINPHWLERPLYFISNINYLLNLAFFDILSH